MVRSTVRSTTEVDLPLRRAEVDKLGSPEELKVDQRLSGRQVLHVVAVGNGEDSGISGLATASAHSPRPRDREELTWKSKVRELLWAANSVTRA